MYRLSGEDTGSRQGLSSTGHISQLLLILLLLLLLSPLLVPKVAAALEFSVAAVPSLVTTELGGSLYLGGYKAAVNLSWLREARVGLVVDTAGGLGATLGPGYARALRRRSEQLAQLRVVQLQLRDEVGQVLEEEVLRATAKEVLGALKGGEAVLVHCAQGRSRSTAVVVVVMCWGLRLGVEEALAKVRERRAMAQPNTGFMDQLLALERRGGLAEL